MPRAEVPELRQAEAYYEDGTLLMIRNSKMEEVAKLVRGHRGLAGPDVPDFPAFLDTIAPILAGVDLVVAVGDSTTANYSNWPYRVSRRLASDGTGLLVVNLADWSANAASHVRPLEYLLEFAHENKATSISVVFLGGVLEALQRRNSYRGFVSGYRNSPILAEEVELAGHRFGAQIKRLNSELPVDWQEISGWIGRRTSATMQVLGQTVTSMGGQFYAVFQPICNDVPAYLRAFREFHGVESDPATSPDSNQKNKAYPDIFARCGNDLREPLQAVESQWGCHSVPSIHGTFTNLSQLFRNIDVNCFAKHFDALHYGPVGTEMIADAVVDLLPLGK